MSFLFTNETTRGATTIQPQSRLEAIDEHQLLRSEDQPGQIATFDQVRAMGELFIKQNFNDVVPSTHSLPQALIHRHLRDGGGAFWGKLAFGANKDCQFPVTIEVVPVGSGWDLQLYIVPIHFAALEVAQFEKHTDSLLALAAVAAVAPQFILAFKDGISTTNCARSSKAVTSLQADHGTPLAVVFDSLTREQGESESTLMSAISVTGNPDLSIKQAAHLHGRRGTETTLLSQAAAGSKVAGGVPIQTALRSQLSRHALYIPTRTDGLGDKAIVTIDYSLHEAKIMGLNASQLATALGFTAQVIGNSSAEQTIEKVLQPAVADMPLTELVS